MDWCKFHSKYSLRGIQTIFLDGLLPVDGLSKKISHRFSSAILSWERKNGYLLFAYSSRGENCERLSLYTSHLFSTDSILLVVFQC